VLIFYLPTLIFGLYCWLKAINTSFLLAFFALMFSSFCGFITTFITTFFTTFISIDEQLQQNQGCCFPHAGFASWGLSPFFSWQLTINHSSMKWHECVCSVMLANNNLNYYVKNLFCFVMLANNNLNYYVKNLFCFVMLANNNLNYYVKNLFLFCSNIGDLWSDSRTVVETCVWLCYIGQCFVLTQEVYDLIEEQLKRVCVLCYIGQCFVLTQEVYDLIEEQLKHECGCVILANVLF